MGMAALPSGALVLARGVGVHNESLADFWLGRVGDAAGEVELLKGEVSRLRAEQQWLAISRIPRMPAAEGFSWPDGQNGQVSDHQRRGEAPQYPRQLHPVAEASEFATTRRFSKPTRRLITPEDFKKRDEVLRMFIKKSMGFRLNQLDTLSELSLKTGQVQLQRRAPRLPREHGGREGEGGVSGTVRQPTWTPQASQITDLGINAGQKMYDRYTKNSAVQHQSGNPRICRCHPQWPLRQAPPAPVLPERYADSMRDPIRPVHWFHRLVALCDGPAGTDATAGSGATPDNVLACGRC